MRRKARIVLPCILLLSTVGLFMDTSIEARAEWIANGSFEAPAGYAAGAQGVMPPDWVATSFSPDLYSSNGSFGLAPSAFGNFDGVAAQNGLGWVAGAGSSTLTESFGQALQIPLFSNSEYTLSAYLIQAKRVDLDNPGGYDVLLNSANTLADAVLVGTLNPTTNLDVWELAQTSFVAPANANALPWIIFRPYSSVTGTSYPGLDNVSLSAVPEPSSFVIAFIAANALAMRRTRLRSR